MFFLTLVPSSLWFLPYRCLSSAREGCAMWMFAGQSVFFLYFASRRQLPLWKQYLFIIISSLLQNLDALHDHLATIYPGMRAPSFRCTDAEKGKGLILHYYSEREGLQDIVIGIIKTVAQQIHGTEIDMKVMISNGHASEHKWYVEH